MTIGIVPKKARRRTTAQKTATKRKRFGEYKIDLNLVPVNPCRACGRALPEGIIPFCSNRCVAQAADPLPFKKTCIQCFRDYKVGLDTHLDTAAFTCEHCQEENQAQAIRRAKNKRRDMLKLATPKWADLEAIRNVHEQCRLKSQATGVSHEVDHVVPITSDIVCGLNIAANLRIITEAENQRKGNKFDTSLI